MSTYTKARLLVLLKDWISQAKAAEVRGVSRQAISKLVKQGRLQSIKIESIVLVNRVELNNLKKNKPGKKKLQNG